MVVLLVGACLHPSWASEDLSDRPVIDEELKAYELELDKVIKECMDKEKNPIKQMKCGKSVRERYRREGKIRGTDEYCQKHYGKLDKAGLEKIWQQIKQQRRKARIYPDEVVPGEVTEGDLMVEDMWIESRLAQLQKENIKSIEKEVYKKTE